jgi:pimeloyl-ACP methyl ester carboxylesterase
MPGSDPQEVSSWRPLSGDFVEALRTRFDGPVVVVGHSLGGVLSLMAAADYPELFRALVLLDPVVFSGVRSVAWGLAKRFGRTHRMPLLAGALRRREFWPDRETARRSWQGKPAFSGWTSGAFDAYIEAGLEEDGGAGGVRLRYPKAWEARIFELAPHNVWRDIGRLEIPVLLMRGEDSDTLTPEAATRFVRQAPDVEYRVVPGVGHMLPMQEPARVAGMIGDWLEKRL